MEIWLVLIMVTLHSTASYGFSIEPCDVYKVDTIKVMESFAVEKVRFSLK